MSEDRGQLFLAKMFSGPLMRLLTLIVGVVLLFQFVDPIAILSGLI